MSTHDPLGAPPHGAPQQDSTAQGPGPYPPPPPPPASRKEAKAAAKAARAHAKALRPWYRKKRWWAVGALVLVIGVAAVAGGGADEADDADAPAASQPAGEGAPGEAAPVGSSAGDQEVYAIGQWAHTGDFDVTVHQVQDPYAPSNQFETPQPGHRFVAVEVEVRNTADDARTISTLLGAEVTDSMNRPWHVALAGTDLPQLDGDVPPGGARRGWMVFEVAEDSTGLLLRIKGNLTATGSLFALG